MQKVYARRTCAVGKTAARLIPGPTDPTCMIQANTPNRPRVLILDEDRIILQSLSQFLRREGYEVRTTDRPDDAMALMEAGQAELLLADVNIPGVKPNEFLRDVRRRFPHVVIVVITSYGSIEGA